MELKELLQQMVDVKASDVFVIPGLPLSYKLAGVQTRTNSAPYRPADTEVFVKGLYELAHRDFERYVKNENHDDDFSFAVPGLGRFRANVLRQRGSLAAVIRIIPFGIPDAEENNIPSEVMQLANLKNGLVLMTGPAGSGKSTTLACLIDRINRTRSGHIITMEDPIEYVHRHEKCIVTQREIPTDVATYTEALNSALREAPNVMLLGEMRDYETISTVMTAAEMGQLVFSTLHTSSASGTIDRIIDAFPAAQQRQIRIQLATVLQAVVAQQLVPTLDGNVVPVFEIMVANTAIRNLIREEKSYQIDSVISASGKDGMRTMDQSLFAFAKAGTISKEVALQHSVHQEALEHRFEAEGL